MRKARQSTAKNVMVLMVDSADHITGKTGLTLTVKASKDGGAFAMIAPTVTERGDGWYNLALTSAHTDTLGDLALHITAAGADPADMVILVEAGAVDADVSSRMATFAYTAPDNAGIAAIKARTDNLPADTAAVLAVIDDLVDDLEARLTIARAALLDNLDATISSRLATASYTAPDNAGIAAIKARTDNLPADTATVLTVIDDLVDDLEARLTMARAALLDNLDVAVSSRLATASYTAPDNAGVSAIKAKTDNLPADTAAVLTVIDDLVDDLESRLTATRALLLDNLDVTVSSRQSTSDADAKQVALLSAIDAVPTAAENATALLNSVI